MKLCSASVLRESVVGGMINLLMSKHTHSLALRSGLQPVSEEVVGRSSSGGNVIGVCILVWTVADSTFASDKEHRDRNDA